MKMKQTTEADNNWNQRWVNCIPMHSEAIRDNKEYNVYLDMLTTQSYKKDRV